MLGKLAGADFPCREHRLPLVLGGRGVGGGGVGGEADVNAQIMDLSPLPFQEKTLNRSVKMKLFAENNLLSKHHFMGCVSR